jgi:hypothetical protein
MVLLVNNFCDILFGCVLYLLKLYCLLSKEKAPYEAKAAKKKSEYEKVMKAYNKKQVNISHLILFFVLLTLFTSLT